MTEIKYGQKIITQGFMGGLKSVKEQIREDIQTDQQSLLKDVISCLDVLKGDTPELIITIKKDRYGYPNLIQKTWTVKKEKIKP